MGNYQDYKLEDFLSDPQFVEWIVDPDPAKDFFWKKWIENHPEKEELIREAIFTIKNINFRRKDEDPQQLNRVLDNVLRRSTSDKKSGTGKILVTYGLRIAATIALIIIASLILDQAIFKYGNREISEIPAINFIEKENPRGQKSGFYLPDGTWVKLNSNSRLIFPSAFAHLGKREIELIGEAFFDIKPNADQPFVVKTSQVNVVALGTSFNVKAYDDESETHVALTSGKVMVENNHPDRASDTFYLEPGQKYVYNKDDKNFLVTEFDPIYETGWKDGVLIFRSSNLDQFVEKVERWYGVKVAFNQRPKKEWHINGKFEDVSLEVLLESVKFSKGIDYSIIDKQVYLKF
ncbi:MAG: FecR domain-containing protein [Cytophagales bacterium]|nr:FecR domain-containing protein [Cytophagales bacterium]